MRIIYYLIPCKNMILKLSKNACRRLFRARIAHGLFPVIVSSGQNIIKISVPIDHAKPLLCQKTRSRIPKTVHSVITPIFRLVHILPGMGLRIRIIVQAVIKRTYLFHTKRFQFCGKGIQINCCRSVFFLCRGYRRSPVICAMQVLISSYMKGCTSPGYKISGILLYKRFYKGHCLCIFHIKISIRPIFTERILSKNPSGMSRRIQTRNNLHSILLRCPDNLIHITFPEIRSRICNASRQHR